MCGHTTHIACCFYYYLFIYFCLFPLVCTASIRAFSEMSSCFFVHTSIFFSLEGILNSFHLFFFGTHRLRPASGGRWSTCSPHQIPLQHQSCLQSIRPTRFISLAQAFTTQPLPGPSSTSTTVVDTILEESRQYTSQSPAVSTANIVWKSPLEVCYSHCVRCRCPIVPNTWITLASRPHSQN